MGSAPSLQMDSSNGTINARELKIPHCIPVEPLQMELSDFQQGNHQLLNSLESLGAPTIMHAGAWRRQASHCKWKWHPPQFQGAINWSHTCPHYLWNQQPPHMAPYFPLPILHCTFQQPSQPSHYKCTVPVTIHCKFKGPMVTHQNHHPPLITANELNNRTIQVNLMPPQVLQVLELLQMGLPDPALPAGVPTQAGFSRYDCQ